MVEGNEKDMSDSAFKQGDKPDIPLLHNQGLQLFDWDKKEQLSDWITYSKIDGVEGEFQDGKYAVEEHWLPDSIDLKIVMKETERRMKTLSLLNSYNLPSALKYRVVLVDEVQDEDGNYTVVCFISDAPENSLDNLIHSRAFLKFGEMIMLLYDVCEQLIAYKEANIHHLEVSPQSIVYKINNEGQKIYSLTHWDIRRFIDAEFIPALPDHYKAPDINVEHDQDDLEKLDVYSLVFSALEAFGISFEDLDSIRNNFMKTEPFPLETPTEDINSLVGYTTYMFLNCLLRDSKQRSSVNDLMAALTQLEKFLPILNKFTPKKLLQVLTTSEPVRPYYQNAGNAQMMSPVMFSPMGQSQREQPIKSEVKSPQGGNQAEMRSPQGGNPAEMRSPQGGFQSEIKSPQGKFQPEQASPQNFKKEGSPYSQAQGYEDQSPQRMGESGSKKGASRESSPHVHRDEVAEPEEAFHEEIDLQIEPEEHQSHKKSPKLVKNESPKVKSASPKEKKEIQLETSPKKKSPLAYGQMNEDRKEEEDPGRLVVERQVGSGKGKSGDPAERYKEASPKDKKPDDAGKKKEVEPPQERTKLFTVLSVIHCILLWWFMIAVLLAAIIIRAGSSEAFRSQAEKVNRGLLGLGYLYSTNPIINITTVSAGTSCPSGTEESFGMWPGVQRFCYNPMTQEFNLGVCPIDECMLDCQQFQPGFSSNFTSWGGVKFCLERASGFLIQSNCPSGYTQCPNSVCVMGSTCPLTTVQISNTPADTSTNNGWSAHLLPGGGRYLNLLRDTQQSIVVADLNLTINQKRCIADHSEPNNNNTHYPGLNIAEDGCGEFGTASNFQQVDSDATTQSTLFQAQTWWPSAKQLPGLLNFLTNNVELVQVNYYSMSSSCTTFNATQFLTIQDNFNDFIGRLNASCWAILFWLITFDAVILMLFFRDILEKSKVTIFADPKASEEDRYKRIGVFIVLWMLFTMITAAAGLGSIDRAKGDIQDIAENYIQISGACFFDSEPQKVIQGLSSLIDSQLSSARGGFAFILAAVLIAFVPILVIHIMRKFFRGFKVLKDDVKKLVNEGSPAQ